MINKNRIVEVLSSTSLSLELIAEVLECNTSDLKPLLDEMVKKNEIKYLEDKALYKINKNGKRLDKAYVYSLIKNNNIYDYYMIQKSIKASYKEINAILDELIKDGKIDYFEEYDTYGDIKLARVNVKPQGYAFAYVEEENKDYYIPLDFLNNVYDGDICTIVPYEIGHKLINAYIYKVEERAHSYVIGVLKEKKTRKGIKYYIKSTMSSFDVNVGVRPEALNGAPIGSIVEADVIYQGTAIIGSIKSVVGYPDDPGIDISQIALEYGFKTAFSDETVKEIENIPDIVLEDQLEGRRDFRNKNVITIDGDDSKDFDDAVWVERLPNGNYQLEVYIADVAEYVKENTSLDSDALDRGTSVYLADRVIPMLPRKLSNGICSLNEGVDRLVLACLMEIDLKGNLANYEIVEGVIKSSHRMTYKNVNKILDGDIDLSNQYSDILDMLHTMKELSDLIRKRRYKKGGIEFDTLEYKFNLNQDGSPKEIIKRDRLDAEKLIEDFMLMANETVAYHMSIMNLPSVYRIHEKPDQEKLHQVFSSIQSMNVPVKNIKNDIHPKQIQTVLEDVSDNPNKLIINNMLLRSMMKAKYSPDNLGHYGLAMNYYCHFTSPIRRYPDLMTHRMIKKLYLHPNNFDVDLQKYATIVGEVSLRNSASERKAIECERAVNDMLFAWYMSSYITKSFTGTITSMTSFGMFITLDNGVEGLLSYQNMNGYFEYNEAKYIAIGPNKVYHLGDKVKIVVVYANKKDRKIDFMLEEDYKRVERNENYLF
ncbi:MAG: ribonuclease R [Acholeplasmatales bacterium]|nr:ribonuclease R [Acholeplasmatales bacterium]